MIDQPPPSTAREDAVKRGECPTRELLERIGDKWSVLVVMYLSEDTHRFNALRRRIEGISQRMLTETLRKLERDGLVQRTVYPTVPVRVEYCLTPLGRTLIVLLTALAAWVENHRPDIIAARADYDRVARMNQAAAFNEVS